MKDEQVEIESVLELRSGKKLLWLKVLSIAKNKANVSSFNEEFDFSPLKGI